LRERIEDPDKQWKISLSDFKERRYWSRYMKAYEETIAATSTKHAPWFVIPSDHKWYRNIAISQIIVDAMKGLDLKYPKPTINPKDIRL
jgi:polyphosphate kinase 2 (PPK2 family)